MTVEYSFLFRLKKININFIRFIVIVALRLKIQKKTHSFLESCSTDFSLKPICLTFKFFTVHEKNGVHLQFLSVKLNFFISE